MKTLIKTDFELESQMVFFDVTNDSDDNPETFCVYRPEDVPEGWSWELLLAYKDAHNKNGLEYSDAVKCLNHDLQHYCIDHRIWLTTQTCWKHVNWMKENNITL